MTTTTRGTRPAPPAPARRVWVEPVMGMPVSIHLRAGDPGCDPGSRAATAAVARAFETFHELDAIFSTYRADSQLMRLRREEVGIEACSPLLQQALAVGERAEVVTRRAFPTLLPTGEGDLAFDPTGLVKGWAVDLASEHLTTLPGLSWCINAGGDLRVGAHPELPRSGADAVSWRVGVEDPRDRSRIAETVTLVEGAVATSGTAARGAHLYDPTLGRAVARPGSVTVVGPTLLWADIWATALFVGSALTHDAFSVEAPQYRSVTL